MDGSRRPASVSATVMTPATMKTNAGPWLWARSAAPTGAIALAMIRDEPPDAILCDHRMAGMNGTEFHDAVSAIEPELGRRFAFMSGDVLNPDLREFATARGILLLGKPFDIATVGRTVATLLGSEPAA
jgi:CheY-like chemotaxis protein